MGWAETVWFCAPKMASIATTQQQRYLRMVNFSLGA